MAADEEADAIIACCWRYGSYAHVLTAGELFPRFPKDRSLSRIDDSEMHRINLEFSSGLAAWIAQRASAPGVINKRVRAAIVHLPMPWRDKKAISWTSDIDVAPFEARLRNLLRDEPLPETWSKALTPREEANHLVAWSYRNGPIEDVHAGRWSVGSELPGFKRLYAADVVRVARFARRRLAWHLATREHLDPILRSLILQAKAFGSAAGWSVSSETTAVRFPGLPGLGPLDARLRWLAERWPAAYGGTAVPG